MAKGAHTPVPSNPPAFWHLLSEHRRDQVEQAACREHKVDSFFDLDPDVRREVREQAVQAALKEGT